MTDWKRGDRVRLVLTTDYYTKLEPGTTGTVSLVDGLGTVFVDWDNGSKLGMVPGADVIERDIPELHTNPWDEKPAPVSDVRYPDVTVKLSGTDGNAYAVLAKVRGALRRAGHGDVVTAEFMTEATSSDYNHLLATCMRWVNVE